MIRSYLKCAQIALLKQVRRTGILALTGARKEIINSIDETGVFHHGPDQWTTEIDLELTKLLAEGVIEPYSSINQHYTNAGYYYIRKGNPQGVYEELKTFHNYTSTELVIRPRNKRF